MASVQRYSSGVTRGHECPFLEYALSETPGSTHAVWRGVACPMPTAPTPTRTRTHTDHWWSGTTGPANSDKTTVGGTRLSRRARGPRGSRVSFSPFTYFSFTT